LIWTKFKIIGSIYSASNLLINKNEEIENFTNFKFGKINRTNPQKNLQETKYEDPQEKRRYTCGIFK